MQERLQDMEEGPLELAAGASTTAGKATAPRRRTILLTAMGTRGDVQPFVALGLHLAHVRRWRVVLAIPPEYRSFVEAFGLEAEDIGISLQHAVSSSPQGRVLRTANALTAFQATRDFFRLPLLESWFASIRRLLVQLRPNALLLSGFVAMSGAGALPQLLGLPTCLILSYTIPMSPTAEFGMPLAGTGFSAPVAWLNRLQWDALSAAVSQRLHEPHAQQIVDGAVAEAEAGAACCGYGSGSSSSSGGSSNGCGGSNGGGGSSGGGSPTSMLSSSVGCRIKLGPNLTPSPAPTLYIYSPALLPKPADWPAHSHVVGPLLLRRFQSLQAERKPGASVGLPASLQQYLDVAARAQVPVVYIGLGSMLGTVFEPAEVERLIACIEQAVLAVSLNVPVCAIIHTTLLPGSSDKAQAVAGVHSSYSGSLPGGACAPPEAVQQGKGLPLPFMLLTAPVPHELLLPQVDFCIHHGGAGTTQAALLAGKPALVVPCVPSSDQPFWADLVHRRGLGPPWFPVRRLTAARLAASIQRGLLNLRQYTAAAETLAFQMAQEDGVTAAADIIEAAVAEA